MEERKIRLEKIKELENATHKFNIEVGHIKEGLFFRKPIVGKSFFVGYGYATSLVTEIIDEHVFKTLNSVYRWEFID